MNKKILVLYTSVGLGHKYSALNIVYHLEQAGYQVRAFDVLQLQEGLLVNLGKWLHGLVNEHAPFIWRWLYFSKWFSDMTLPWRVPLAGRNYAHIKQEVAQFQPDLIITTQTSASAPIAYMKRHGEFNNKFYIAFSDFHLHRYWLYEEADGYLVNIEEQKQEMVQLSIAPETIFVCGITLQPVGQFNKVEVKQKLGINREAKVIVLASGSLGIGFTAERIKEYAQQIHTALPGTNLIVVCGKNQDMKDELEAMNLPHSVILGFYQPMGELYSIADVFLTKPGGLSISEALQAGCRIVITHWLPGQEELNYRYLLQNKLVTPTAQPVTTQTLVQATEAALVAETPGETPASAAITQKHHEGEMLKKAVNAAFHGV